tara:strand:- start:172 stop:372 length:201 start_codon:yes stop_codon:yes gene_type:complete
MFVQSKTETQYDNKNGVALEQRRNGNETLVQWENGKQRWVPTSDLLGEVRLIGNSGMSMESDDYGF